MAQSDIPIQRSQQQILGQMLDSFTSRAGIRKLKIGNPILSILESVSLSTAKSTYDAFKALNSKDIDNISGAALQSAGNDENLPQLPPLAATTYVNITDTNFEKISSTVYHGSSAPIAGSQSINVTKGPTFDTAASTGVIYIGRGTERVEGPISYTAKTDNSNYWTLTLASPITSFHNQGEEVVVGQGGDRNIGTNQLVSTPSGALSEPVQYTVLVPGTILDGETTLYNILVRCTQTGVKGNVPQNTIIEFGGTPPFAGAAVTNPNPVTSGRDLESTQAYRDRIKKAKNTKTKGTSLAITEAVRNLTAPDEAKTVLSASLQKRYQNASILYIDDGNGYEPISSGVGYEILRSDATGGEQDFVTINSPIVLASVTSNNPGPYAITSGLTLQVQTGYSTETHYFDASVFNDPNVATPYDISNSINSNSLLSFRARVTNNSSKVTLFPKDDSVNIIQVLGGTANEILGFPTNKNYTSLLYKNDRLISTLDYNLNRATGALKTVNKLLTGDTLTLGSLWSKGFVESSKIDLFNLASDQNLYFALDSGASVIDSANNNISTLIINVYKALPSSLQLLVANSSNFSSNVEIGQNLLLYKTGNNSLPSALEGVYKIIDKPAANQVVIEYNQMTAARKMAASANFTLSGNKVLICGGLCSHNSGILDTAEIYNTDTYTVTQAASMNHARYGHTATLLSNGSILVVGGLDKDGNALTSAEIYNPGTNTWTAATSMGTSRYLHSAVLLPSGSVLVAGGLTGSNPTWTTLSTSIEYNPTGNVWENPASFGTERYSTTLITIPDSKVFMIGGLQYAPDLLNEDTDHTANTKKFSATTACNIYNATAHTWSGATAVPEAVTRTAYRNYTGALATSNTIVAVADTQYYLYNISGNSWTNKGSISQSASYDVYNGTSVLNQTNVAAYAYSSLGRTNPLVTTVNGTIVMAFAERYVVADTSKQYCHYKYDSGTDLWYPFGTANTYSAGRSFFTAVASNTNSDEVIVFGGQQGIIGQMSLAESYTAESYISSNIDTINTVTSATTNYVGITGTYVGIQGWVIYSSVAPVTKTTVPANNNYIASGLASAISIDGATAKTYKNSTLRISTNNNSGDILLLGPTIQNLTQEVSEASSPSTNASVKSIQETSVPYDFRVYQVGQVNGNSLTVPAQQAQFSYGTPEIIGGYLPLNGTLKGLFKKNFWEDSLLELPFNWPAATQNSSNNGFELGNFKNEIARINQRDLIGTYLVTATNTAPDSTVVSVVSNVIITPNQPVYCGSPFLFNTKDKLTVTVDNNSSVGRFTIPMSRKVKSANNNYASLITINDAENSNLSLARKFGLDYKYDNFFVSMKARNKLGNILYRYYRFGQDGENYVVKYEYNTIPNSSTSITINHNWKHLGNNYSGHLQKSSININLPTGDLYTAATITPTTKLGVMVANLNTTTRIADLYAAVGFSVIEAERTAIGGQTRLKIQYPSADVNTMNWFQVGDYIRFDALTPTPTTLQSGQARVSYVSVPSGDIQNIYIAELSLDDGTSIMAATPNPGWVSLDPSAEALVQFDNNIAVNDLAVLDIISSSVNDKALNDKAFRITTVHDKRQWIKCKARVIDSINFSYYKTVGASTIVKIIKGIAITESNLVTAINALNGVVTGTLIDTSSSITEATWDSQNHWDAGSVLVDGLNAVLSTVNPVSVSADYQINLKKTVNSNLTSNADFANEEIYLIPSYAKDIVKWLNTPCITGLWTLANSTLTDSGTSIQVESKTLGRDSSIQVAGVGSNGTSVPIINASTVVNQDIPTSYPNFIATIDSANADTFVAGSMVKITNTNLTQKQYEVASPIHITNIAADGTLSFDTPPYHAGTKVTTTGSIERVGDFTLIRLTNKVNNAWSTGTYPGDYIYINRPTYGVSTFDSLLDDVSIVNQGVFRIVNISHNNSVIWVENTNSVTEKCVMDITFVTANSIVPGDILTIVSDNLGIANKGSWVVESVGLFGDIQFMDSSLKLALNNKALQPVSGSNVMNNQSIQALDGTPRVFYKKLIGINLASDPSYTELVLTSNSVNNNPTLVYELGAISSTSGSVISSLNKLGFSTELQTGIDAYRYNTGLIGEAKKVIYGSEDDPINYPGVVSDGASILIDGPIIKSLKLGFNVKIIGNPNADMADKIKSAIAGVINSNPQGTDIAISDLTTAGGAIDNVISIQALYNSDTIKVSPSEKTKILNLNDISIIFME